MRCLIFAALLTLQAASCGQKGPLVPPPDEQGGEQARAAEPIAASSVAGSRR